MSDGQDLDVLAAGLAGRLGEFAASVRRAEAFVYGPTQPESPDRCSHPDPTPSSNRRAAEWMVLRTLRAAAAEEGWRLLSAAADPRHSNRAPDEPPVVGWEVANDLVQVGLVARTPDLRSVVLTPAGEVLARRIAGLITATLRAVAP